MLDQILTTLAAMRWLEAVGLVSGLFCVWLLIRQNIWTWPIGLLYALVSVADLKAANIVGSHQAARRWVEGGKLPEPIVLPNGFLRWLARDVLKAIGVDTDQV